MYDTYGLYSLNHTAGALAIFGLWGMASAFNSTASLSATNFISISNASLQKYDLSFVPLNKTGTCFYQLANVLRGETADVLNGTRTVFGPTATDAGYKMGTSGNWISAVSNVAGALDSLAANKIATTQKAAINGVASLDGTGKVPLSQLPVSLDDILEFANLLAFPITGTSETIYIALDTNKIYRWNTTVYTELAPAPATYDHGALSGLSDDDHTQYHTDSRADARYYTKSQIDSSVVYKNGTTPFAANQSMGGFKLTNLADPVALTDAVNLQTLNASLGSTNDIREKSFAIYDDEIIPIPITDFKFENATSRSFDALVSVRVQASSNLSETFEIRGIQKDSDWYISISSEGDYSKVIFSIDSSGQMYYVSGTYAGFIDGVLKFRAITTSV
jgi:hypothetical protein